MLTELLHSWALRAPRWARRLGLASEHVAIDARFRRVRSSWKPHLETSQRVILEHAEQCKNRRHVFIIGAGSCLDVPVTQLTKIFGRVTLADVVTSFATRRLARRFPEQVQCITWDATGALETLAEKRTSLSADAIETLFSTGTPLAPIDAETDLVISANCLTQLGLIPTQHLPTAESKRCAIAAARRHLAWLADQNSAKLLIADTTRLQIDREGNEVSRDDMREAIGLPLPKNSWIWRVAPLGEWRNDRELVHEVGCWFWPNPND